MADGSDLIGPGPVRNGDLRGALGHAVALLDRDAKLVVVVRQLRRKISTAADQSVQAVAQHLVRRFFAGHARIGGHETLDAVVESLCQHRHHADHGGLEVLDALGDLGKLRIQGDIAAVAGGQQDVAGNAEHMVDGQNVQAGILGRISRLIIVKNVVRQVSVAQHDSLALSGGAGGEEDHGEILGLRVRLDIRNGGILRENVLGARHVLALLQTVDGGKSRAPVFNALDAARKVPVVEQHVHVGTVQVVGKGLKIQLDIQRDADSAAGHQAKHQGNVVGAGASQKTDLDGMADFAAGLRGPHGESVAFRAQMAVGDIIDGIVSLIAEKHSVGELFARLV